MGISGLHPLLKPYLAQSHVRDFRGHRLGVDASSWLHRGAVGAARELATGERPWVARGYDAPWVVFCMKMATMLQAAGVTPVLVFDGCRLPAKADTNTQRRQRRSDARERALSLLREGRETEANAAFMQSVHVTPDMAHELIVRLRQRGVEFVVAPYEADAQLAHLASIPEEQGGVAAVVTEDSDLVAYGCSRLLFKMDSGGYCWELSTDRLFAGPPAAIGAGTTTQGSAGDTSLVSENCSGNGGAASSSAGGGKSGGSKRGGGVLSFQGWTLDMLQAACVLAGCDFLPSLKGVSFRTAAGFVARRRGLEGALGGMRAEKRFRTDVTEEYRQGASRALLAFRHALVFCHNTGGGCLRRLVPLPGASWDQRQRAQQQPEQQEQAVPAATGAAGAHGLTEADLAHLGAELDAEVARGIAYGRLHPHTLQPFAGACGAQDSSPATQRCLQHGPGPRHPQQRPQQLHASLAGRRQLGSWMAGAAHSSGLGSAQRQQRHPQHGGPRSPHPHLLGEVGQQALRQGPPRQAQQAQPRQAGPVNVADVLQLYRPVRQHATPPAGQRQTLLPSCDAAAAGAPAQRNPFARLQPGASAAAAAAGEDACPAVHASVGLPEQQSAAAEAAGTQASAAPAAPASGPPEWRQQQEHPQTVLHTPAGDARSQSACATTNGSAATGPAGGHSSGVPPQPGLDHHHGQQQRQQQVWNRAEQHMGRGSPLAGWGATAAAAGTKRKSTGGGGGSGKKGPRQLAPPSHRISRFFPPAPK